ncbi:MAG: zinc ribbon domain-containing protein [Pseudomonadota bacterium]
MPVYDYWCDECGAFEALAPIANYADPCACPQCAALSPRVMLKAPTISKVSSAVRRAHEVNERSADSPKRSSHGPGIAARGPELRRAGSRVTVHSDGSKSFASQRPWMISH